jgi:RimJ/RimL family protein N-acetyltransferase
MLTKAEQATFYHSMVAWPEDGDCRYWAIKEERGENHRQTGLYKYDTLIGMGGLTDISLENRNAEISLIIDPELRGKGYGEQAVELILDQGFNFINLFAIYGEVYECNGGGVDFWEKIIEKYNAYSTDLPHRKYWNGDSWGSIHFTITREMFDAK